MLELVNAEPTWN